jgi:radical SAM superfamily enzyme YgiQ (UPF0313 family)
MELDLKRLRLLYNSGWCKGEQEMDLLLIRPNDMKAVYGGVLGTAACEPPYWAAVIAEYGRQKGLQVGILDMEAQNLSPQQAVKIVEDENPALVGIIVTGTNLSASTQKMPGAGQLATCLKEQLQVPMFLWGLHPSAVPEKTMEEEAVDYVIKGESLDTILHLVEVVKKERGNLEELLGLYYRKGEEILGNPQIQISSPEEIPNPAWDLLPMELYKAHNWQLFGEEEKRNGNYAVIATSLGCPFQCSFCAINAMFGMKKVRFFTPERVVEDIQHLVTTYGVKYIKIMDENFVLNQQHVEKICDLLIERNLDINMWAYARVDTVSEALLGKMYQAGMRWLAFGIESASELSLNDVSKGQYNVKKVKEVMEMTQKAGISIMANFMFGLPEDTQESMEANLSLARELNPEYINFYCTLAYPGSKLYTSILEQSPEQLPQSWKGFAQYGYECQPLPTNTLTAKEVLAFRDQAFDEFFQNNTKYFQMIEYKFGKKTVEDIQSMLGNHLKRKLLGD